MVFLIMPGAALHALAIAGYAAIGINRRRQILLLVLGRAEPLKRIPRD